MDRVLQQVAQNIKLKNKINEANHDYQVLRRRAVLRRNNRLKHRLAESYAIEKKLLNDVGVESYKPKVSIAERLFHITISVILVAMLVASTAVMMGLI
jgi:hypothetical protein